MFTRFSNFLGFSSRGTSLQALQPIRRRYPRSSFLPINASSGVIQSSTNVGLRFLRYTIVYIISNYSSYSRLVSVRSACSTLKIVRLNCSNILLRSSLYSGVGSYIIPYLVKYYALVLLLNSPRSIRQRRIRSPIYILARVY